MLCSSLFWWLPFMTMKPWFSCKVIMFNFLMFIITAKMPLTLYSETVKLATPASVISHNQIHLHGAGKIVLIYTWPALCILDTCLSWILPTLNFMLWFYTYFIPYIVALQKNNWFFYISLYKQNPHHASVPCMYLLNTLFTLFYLTLIKIHNRNISAKFILEPLMILSM